MADFKEGQRVRYISDTMPNIKGKEGVVQSVSPRGWVEVAFAGENHTIRCAQANLQIVDPRRDALFAAFDILTAYLTDECPEGVNWEDFDPEVDDLRTRIDELGGS